MVLRILEMIDTSGFLTFRVHQICFRRGSTRTQLGELTTLPRLPSWFKGPTYKRERKTEKGEAGKSKGKGGTAPYANSWIRSEHKVDRLHLNRLRRACCMRQCMVLIKQ